jgi:hypothetical protein
VSFAALLLRWPRSMTERNRFPSRRRWPWTVLFLVVATISMVGPTQAVSGVVTASIAVMEQFQLLLGSDSALSPRGVPLTNRAERVDPAVALQMMPLATSQLTEASQAAASIGDVASFPGDAVAGIASSSRSGGSGGTGGGSGPANQIGRPRGGFAVAGPGGSATAGAIGSRGEQLTNLMLTEVAQQVGIPEKIADPAALALVTDSELGNLIDGPSGPHAPFVSAPTVPGAWPGEASAPGAAPSVDGATFPAHDAVAPLIPTPLIPDEVGLSPPSDTPSGGVTEPRTTARTVAAAVAQVPEPSALLLLSLGGAFAAAYRRRRQIHD